MNSKIIKSEIYHQRLGHKSNAFSYNALMFLIDLDELEILNSKLNYLVIINSVCLNFPIRIILHKIN